MCPQLSTMNMATRRGFGCGFVGGFGVVVREQRSLPGRVRLSMKPVVNAVAGDRSRKRLLHRCFCAEGVEHAEEVKKTWDIELKSPSKINLFLRILRRRDDGFHDLASLFQAISLHDDLNISLLPETAEEDILECDSEDLPLSKDNLVLRALDVFRRNTGRKERFHVELVKRVPVQAGLGGGSGNAATALWGANQLCGRIVDDQQLAAYGAEIGSDISFFFSTGTAYCTGRGEILDSRKPLPPTALYIIKPKEGLSTRKVFQTLDLGSVPNIDPIKLLETMETKMIYLADFVNDLEVPSFKLCPKLADIKEALDEAGFRAVLMSGSGTAFFALGEPLNEFLPIFETRMQELFDVDVYRARFAERRPDSNWYIEPYVEPKTHDEDAAVVSSSVA